MGLERGWGDLEEACEVEFPDFSVLQPETRINVHGFRAERDG